MPFHFAAAGDDLLFLCGEIGGLASELLRGGVDRFGGRVYLRLFPSQASPVVQKCLTHVGNTALPIDEVLAEGGDGKPMIRPVALNGEFLGPQSVELGLHLRAQSFQVNLALARVFMQLGQMAVQLLARLSEPSQGGFAAEFEIGQLLI
jgi:hypothetical protein